MNSVQFSQKNSENKWSFSIFQSNIFAGLTVGVVALPLSMALAIASGAPPQNGLYTAIVAGIVIALSGGCKVNISGPTAAFVVILQPVIQKYGLGGLLISGMMAGFILCAMGFGRLGTLIELVPYPVTVGFTAGIGTVIATIQIKDFFGLSVQSLNGHYIDKVKSIILALPTFQWQELIIALITFFTLVLWSKLKTRIPAHLVALIIGTICAYLSSSLLSDFDVATIGSTFHYTIGSLSGNGIPPILPQFVLPWKLPDANGNPIGISFGLISTLLGSSFVIAMLGALESLLCAVVADSMGETKTNPNRELIGQGIGNIIVPFFGGIPATAAIARTATSIRSGGSSPLASVVHAFFILISLLFLSPLLGYIPMASMAALLIIVAWNMSEAKHFVHILKVAPRNDIIVLLTCFSLTVLFDMGIAVATGMVMAAILFIKRTIELTEVKFIEQNRIKQYPKLPDKIAIYDITGPMFFGAAQSALKTLINIRKEIQIVVLDMKNVTMMDMTAIVAMGSIIEDFKQNEIFLIINDLQPRMILKLRKFGIRKKTGQVDFSKNMNDAVKKAMKGYL